MYQIRYTDGMEMNVIGKGKNGLCTITDRHGAQRFAGKYDECVKWLKDRSCRETGAPMHSTAHTGH